MTANPKRKLLVLATLAGALSIALLLLGPGSAPVSESAAPREEGRGAQNLVEAPDDRSALRAIGAEPVPTSTQSESIPDETATNLAEATETPRVTCVVALRTRHAGEPVPGAKVRLRLGRGEEPLSLEGITDPEGEARFELDSFPERVELEARGSGGGELTRWAGPGAARIELRVAAVTLLHGRVEATDLEPAARASAFAISAHAYHPAFAGLRFVGRAAVEADGTFRIPTLLRDHERRIVLHLWIGDQIALS